MEVSKRAQAEATL